MTLTLMDDSTNYCYVYLVKAKDEALHYFKIYKTKVDNQHERKIKKVCQIVMESTFLMSLIYSVWNMV